MRKKKNNEEKVIEAMDALDRSVRSLQKFGARYDAYIDEAAIRGDDARAKQLIKQKIRVYQLCEQLKTLKSNIELGAFTAHAISELGKLPDAITGCKGLLAESPDFTKLGKSITAIFKDIDKSEQGISKLNEILEPTPKATIASRLDGAAEDELTDQFKTEYAAMIERVKGKVTPENVANPAQSAIGATGDIDYAGIVAEENKKK